jgi:uncharacterized protein
MGLFRLVLIVAIGYLAYRVGRNLFRPPGRIGSPPPDGVIGEMVQDPQCGTYVPKQDAIRRAIRGRQHYFCSETCAERFASADRNE